MNCPASRPAPETTRRFRRTKVTLAVLGLTVAAGGVSVATGVTPPVDASAAGTAPPWRIGVLVNATGQFVIGEQHAPPVLEAWTDEVNASHGVAGRQVELIIEDTKGDPSNAASVVDGWATDGDLDSIALFDVFTETSVADAITATGVPVIGGNGATPTAWGALPNWFPVNTTFPSLINLGWVMADEVGATSTAYVVCAENPTCAAAEPVAVAAAEALGLTYSGTLTVSAASPDFTAECLQLLDDGVDYVMLGLTASLQNMRFVEACQTQGYSGQWGFFGALVEPDVMVEADPGVPINIAFSSFPWFVDDEPVVRYRDVMQAHGVAEEHWAGPIGPSAWATMELFRTTMEANAERLPDDVTAADVIAAYGTIDGEDLDGLLAQPVTFTGDEPAPPLSCYWLGVFEDGEFGGTSLTDPVCDPPALSAG